MLLRVCVPLAAVLAIIEAFSVGSPALRNSPDKLTSLKKRDTGSMAGIEPYLDNSWQAPYDFPVEQGVPQYGERMVPVKRGRLDALIARLSRLYGPSNNRGHPLRFGGGR